MKPCIYKMGGEWICHIPWEWTVGSGGNPLAAYIDYVRAAKESG